MGLSKGIRFRFNHLCHRHYIISLKKNEIRAEQRQSKAGERNECALSFRKFYEQKRFLKDKFS